MLPLSTRWQMYMLAPCYWLKFFRKLLIIINVCPVWVWWSQCEGPSCCVTVRCYLGSFENLQNMLTTLQICPPSAVYHDSTSLKVPAVTNCLNTVTCDKVDASCLPIVSLGAELCPTETKGDQPAQVEITANSNTYPADLEVGRYLLISLPSARGHLISVQFIWYDKFI